jgi:hypothetical protein
MLGFFTDEGDWAYVVDYERCGIVAANVTHTGGENDTPWERKRIVIQLRCGTKYSVIRMGGVTPPGCWNTARLNSTGCWAGEDIDHYTTHQLFDTFKAHAKP